MTNINRRKGKNTGDRRAIGSSQRAAAQDVPRGFINRVYRDALGEHKYVLFLPADYTPEKKWPLILFLHGAGERGTDGMKQTKIGLGTYVKAREKTFPFIVVFPQCEDTKGRVLNGWLADTPDAKRASRGPRACNPPISASSASCCFALKSTNKANIWQAAARKALETGSH